MFIRLIVNAIFVQHNEDSSEGLLSVSTEKAKAATILPGKVEKVIQSHPQSGEPEKAQISVEGADHLYKEIRVPNQLTDGDGKKVKLKQGAEVDIKIEAEPAHTKTTEEAVPKQ